MERGEGWGFGWGGPNLLRGVLAAPQVAHDPVAGRPAEPGVFGVGGDPLEVTQVPLVLQAALVGHVLPVHPGDKGAAGGTLVTPPPQHPAAPYSAPNPCTHAVPVPNPIASPTLSPPSPSIHGVPKPLVFPKPPVSPNPRCPQLPVGFGATPDLLSSCCMKFSAVTSWYITCSCPGLRSGPAPRARGRPFSKAKPWRKACSSCSALRRSSAFSISLEMFRLSASSFRAANFTSLRRGAGAPDHSRPRAPSARRLSAGNLLRRSPNQLAKPPAGLTFTSAAGARSCPCSLSTFSSMPFITFSSMAECPVAPADDPAPRVSGPDGALRGPPAVLVAPPVVTAVTAVTVEAALGSSPREDPPVLPAALVGSLVGLPWGLRAALAGGGGGARGGVLPPGGRPLPPALPCSPMEPEE